MPATHMHERRGPIYRELSRPAQHLIVRLSLMGEKGGTADDILAACELPKQELATGLGEILSQGLVQ